MKEGESCPQQVDLASGGLIRSYGGWQGVERIRQEHIICIGDERILGSSEFVELALRHDKLSTEKATTLARAGWDIEKLREWVCEYTGIDRDDLSGKARGGKLSNAKAILCYLGKTELGLTIREISDFLSISQPSTTIWVKKGELLCKENAISLGTAHR